MRSHEWPPVLIKGGAIGHLGRRHPDCSQSSTSPKRGDRKERVCLQGFHTWMSFCRLQILLPLWQKWRYEKDMTKAVMLKHPTSDLDCQFAWHIRSVSGWWWVIWPVPRLQDTPWIREEASTMATYVHCTCVSLTLYWRPIRERQPHWQPYRPGGGRMRILAELHCSCSCVVHFCASGPSKTLLLFVKKDNDADLIFAIIQLNSIVQFNSMICNVKYYNNMSNYVHFYNKVNAKESGFR